MAPRSQSNSKEPTERRDEQAQERTPGVDATGPQGSPEGPPEGPPDGEESRLGDPFEFPFDVPKSTLGTTSVLLVAERLGGTPSSWAANTPLPEAGSSPGLGVFGQSTVPGPAGLLLFLVAGRGTGRRSRRSL